MYKLIEKIDRKLNEETTSSAVSFLPGSLQGIASLKKSISKLLQHKDEWNIEVIEEGNNYKLNFENQLSVLVPRNYYNEFNDMVLDVRKGKANVSNLLNEAITSNFEKLIDTLILGLKQLPQIKQALYITNSFIQIFPRSIIINSADKYMLNFLSYADSVSKLLVEINKRYSNDTGYLERLISTIEDQLPFNSLGIFKDYNFLAGSSLKVKFDNVIIRLEVRVNLALKNSEVLFVDDDGVLDNMRYYRNLKVNNSSIQPFNSFTIDDFANLKKTIIGRKENE